MEIKRQECTQLEDRIAMLKAEATRQEKVLAQIRSRVISIAGVPDIVKVIVGGQLFMLPKSSFTTMEGTFFRAYFSGQYAPPQKIDDAYYIDRDPTHFRSIIKIISGDFDDRDFEDFSMSAIHGILKEMDFYSISYTIKHGTTRHCIYIGDKLLFKKVTPSSIPVHA